jgi:hypothetical protein
MNYYKNKSLLLFIYFLGASYFNVFSQPQKNYTVLKVDDFQKKINGKNVSLYFLNNGNINMAITNYGARIVSLCVPDKSGSIADVVVVATVSAVGANLGSVNDSREGAENEYNSPVKFKAALAAGGIK